MTNPTSLMDRQGGGVGTPTIDVQRLARALASPGIDTRQWVEVGTVGFLIGERFFTGALDPGASTEQKKAAAEKASKAIYADELGTVVSVRIESTGQMVTARWNGIGCGRFGVFLFPIRPGDEVTILIPGGDMNSGAISIIDVQSNETAKIPTDWNNDRVLLSTSVPIEIEAPAIRIRSPLLDLNGRKVAFSSEGI